MDGEDIKMHDRDRDREEQRGREEIGGEDLDDRQRETDFGVESIDNTATASTFPDISPVIETPKTSRSLTREDTLIVNFLRDNFGYRDISLNSNDPNVATLRENIEITKHGNIKFIPTAKSGDKRILGQVVLKLVDEELVFSDSNASKGALKEFKQLLESIVDWSNKVGEYEESGVLVDTTPVRKLDFPGMTPTENSELRRSLIPEPNILPETRDFALEKQADHFNKLHDETREELEREENLERFIDLGDRAAALKEARNLVLEQRDLEGVRNEQEEDITRLQKVKKWFKENLVGLSAIGITIAGIITTIIVAGRKALVTAGNALGTFGKAAIKTLKALIPVLTPLLNILSTVLGWAAKGIAWVASNLWVLVIFGVLLVYRWVKNKRKK